MPLHPQYFKQENVLQTETGLRKPFVKIHIVYVTQPIIMNLLTETYNLCVKIKISKLN